MITKLADKTLNLARLNESIDEKQSKLIDSQVYYMREKYVDRGGQSNPYYIIRCHERVPSRYEDLRHEDLYQSKNPGISYKHICRADPFQENEYWKKVTGIFIKERLENFKKMVLENYLQPPGTRHGSYGRNEAHQKFEAKPFEFEISSPWSSIIGLCPLYEGGIADFGAIEGVLKNFTQDELNQLELIITNQKGDILKRSFSSEGRFWFAKLPPGNYRLEIKEHLLSLEKGTKPFGWIKGRSVNDLGDYPTVRLEAPDKTIFNLRTDSMGNYQGHLPPFTYTVGIPGHWFKSKIRVEGNTIISGILMNDAREGMYNAKVILKQKSVEIATTETNKDGSFRFELSTPGKYILEAPGYGLFAKKVAPASIRGKLNSGEQTIIELIAREEVISTTITSNSGSFSFDGLTAGKYTVKTNHPFTTDKVYSLEEQVKGLLYSLDKKPLANETISLIRSVDNTLVGMTKTDNEGAFQFIKVPVGKYIISLDEVRFREKVLYKLTGEITGTLEDEDGVILFGKRVVLYEERDQKPLQSTFTNREGRFAFQNILPGSYYLKCGNKSLKPDDHG
ncbi:MAG: hypothetical protein RIM99_10255 [Cyclobacteriaceae bacterium]